MELYPSISDFKKLVNVAMPLQFWDVVTKEEGIKYYLNDEPALFFLHANGFGKIEYKNTKGEPIFVRVRRDQGFHLEFFERSLPADPSPKRGS